MKLWTDFVGLLGEHYQWFFSGAGIFLASGLFALFKRKQSAGQNQNVKNGNAIQVGRDVKINGKN